MTVRFLSELASGQPFKYCRGCGKNKYLSEYYAHRRMKDGHLNFCKECVKERIRQHRLNNPGRVRAIDKNNYKKKKTKPGFKERRVRQLRSWRTPKKMRAHNLVSRKLSLGRPDYCEFCGIKCQPIAHHPNYDEPDRVIWCCRACHAHLHLRNCIPVGGTT